jgi:hypothetical protein
LEHVAERFSAFYTDLEQEKQVLEQTKRSSGCLGAVLCIFRASGCLQLQH